MIKRMKSIIYLLPAFLLIASCGCRNSKDVSDNSNMSDTSTTDCASIEGQWLLEHVVLNDSLEARPIDIDPESKLYVHFYNDSTFNFQTGCNSIGGRYAHANDSITMSDMMWTEMACEDMRVEELLKDVLPKVETLDWNNDSILRLNTTSSAYIVLKRCESKVKCVEPK